MKKTSKSMWTKEEIKLLIKIWKDMNYEQIAEELGRDISQIKSLASMIRRSGYDLPKKWRVGGGRDQMIKEVLREMRLIR